MTRTSLLLAGLYPLLFLTIALLAAAALAYPVTLWSDGGIRLPTAVGRGAMLILFGGFLPLAIRWKLGWSAMGLSRASKLPVQLLSGLAIGLSLMSLHAWLLTSLNIRIIDPFKLEKISVIHRLVQNIELGMIIALVEELLFRGMLYSAIHRIRSDNAAIVISAFYYTVPHFLSTRMDVPTDAMQWNSGFILLQSALEHLINATDLSSFLALFCAGLFLGCVRNRWPHGLAYCIGIHAGWVAILKTYRSFSIYVPFDPKAWMVGEYDTIIGWIAAGWIVTLALLLWLSAQQANKQTKRVN